MKRILLLISTIICLSFVSAQESDYLPLLQEGKVWNYELRYMDDDFKFQTGTSTDWVDGDTIINGQTMFKICSVDSDKGEIFKSIWYEADKKVYLYSGKGETLYLAYDFSLEPGDDIPTDIHLSGGDWGLFVNTADTINVNDNLRKRIRFASDPASWDFCWIEGVGGPWRLNEPVGHLVSDGREYTLVSCYVGEQCIFEKTDFDAQPVTMGIQQIGNDKNSERACGIERIYDLTGRRITSTPARGIYIQNGKKHVIK